MASSNAITPEDFILLAEQSRQDILHAEEDDPLLLVRRVYTLWWYWADFSLFVVTPTLSAITPPVIIDPELIEGTQEYEFVYPIHDYGYKLTTSKAQDMYTSGMSMCKLFNTIEKMIFLFIERIKSEGSDMETEIEVAFGGHELAQRKAFESIINLSYNVVVTNFEPGTWGERYLQIIKRLSERGYGYPTQTPRTSFRTPRTTAPAAKRR